MHALQIKSLLAVVLGLVISTTLAQDSVGDFPVCAQFCVNNGAALASCSLKDTDCLCSTPKFLQETLDCALTGGVCSDADQATSSAILDSMCPDQPNPTTQVVVVKTSIILSPTTSLPIPTDIVKNAGALPKSTKSSGVVNVAFTNVIGLPLIAATLAGALAL